MINREQKKRGLEDMITRETKFVSFGCLHLPQEDPHYLSVLFQFIEWYKPDKIVLNGDIMDCAPVSHWLKDKRRQQENLRLANDFAYANKILDRLTKTCKDIVYNEGNHEDWIQQAIDLNPEFDGLINLEIGLKFNERRDQGVRIEHHKYGEMSRIGKLYFTHGIYTGLNHARKHVEKFQRSIIYAHTHTAQSYVNYSPYDVKDKHIAKSTGCGLQMNPPYMRNKPSDWVHGFEVGHVRMDGSFTTTTLIVINGEVSYAGKTFRSRVR